MAGRLAARRGHGGAAFLDLVDRCGQDPGARQRDVLGEEAFDTLVSLDLGDLIGVDGTAFKSRRGELSLRATGWTLLAKSLRAPPEKFHGLEDVETRYRHRELDLIANEEARELFILRSKVVARRSAAGSTSAASSRWRRRCSSRSTAARSRGRSSPTTTRSTATCSCGSPTSSTSSA